MIYATRIWKRDGYPNVMDLKAAELNIAAVTHRNVAEIHRDLICGKVVETPLAKFQIGKLTKTY